jgi:hypothetical protein
VKAEAEKPNDVLFCVIERRSTPPFGLPELVRYRAMLWQDERLVPFGMISALVDERLDELVIDLRTGVLTSDRDMPKSSSRHRIVIRSAYGSPTAMSC